MSYAMIGSNARKRSSTVAFCLVVCVFISFLLLLVGCTTLTPTKPSTASQKGEYKTSTESLSSEIPEAGASQDTFGSQSATNPLTLERCIEIALQNNPELSAVSWDAAVARSEKQIKAASRYPNIHLNGSYFHYQDDQRLVAPTSPTSPAYFSNDLVSADIVLRLPLYVGGRFINEIKAADFLLRASEHTLARTKEELVFNVTSTYYNILSQRHVIESLEFSEKVLSQHLERVKNLIAAQKATKVDALRTEVRLSDIDQQLLQARNVQEIQYRLLANQMGMDEYTVQCITLAGDLTRPDTNVEQDVEKVLARAYEQRHDYAAAVAALEAQARRVDIARGQREPQVWLEASYGGRWGIGGSGETATPPSSSYSWTLGQQPSISSSITTPLSNGGSLTTTTSNTGSVTTRIAGSGIKPADAFEDVGRIGFTVDIPLFEGGRIRSQIEQERARLQAAQQRVRKLELQIRLEVETALLNFKSAQDRVEVTAKSIAEAEESLRIEQQKYDYGKGAIVDVLDAQAALLTAQTNYYRALADTNVALAQIALATGGLK